MNDSLLDATLDDLADLPETKAFPPGVHSADMFLTAPVPKAGKRQQIIAKFKYKAAIELSDATAAAPNEGDEATIFISIYKKDGSRNEFGEGQLKMLLKPLKEAGLDGNTRELIEATKPGVAVTIVTALGNEYNGEKPMLLKKIDIDA